MLFRTRALLVRQRTQTIIALRGHLAEFGVIAPRDPVHIGRLALVLENPDSGLPEAVRELGGLLLEQIAGHNAKIEGLEREIHASARQDEETRRPMSVPGIGPINAMAIQAFAPPMESFRRGRDFSAWLGLVPRQHTTGGKPKLGKISKMGQRDLFTVHGVYCDRSPFRRSRRRATGRLYGVASVSPRPRPSSNRRSRSSCWRRVWMNRRLNHQRRAA